MERVFNIPDVGDVKLVSSKRAKMLNISIRPFHGIKVSVPNSMSFEEAQKIVQGKKQWLIKHSEKILGAEKELTRFVEDTDFSTRDHQLVIKRNDKSKSSVRVTADEISVKLPASEEIDSPSAQETIRNGIERAWRKEAKAYLPERVSTLAEEKGFTYREVVVKNMKTRWGSCSPDNNINLSLHLMRLPDHLLDYVIMHELVHTKIKNHSHRFWSSLDAVVGDAKGLDREVRGWGIQVW